MDLLTEVKAISPKLSEGHDVYLSVMVPMLEEYVIGLCNNKKFTKNAYGDIVLPGPVKIFIAKACEYNMQAVGLKERSMGSVSYSYDLEFPNTLHQYLRPYRKVKIHVSR